MAWNGLDNNANYTVAANLRIRIALWFSQEHNSLQQNKTEKEKQTEEKQSKYFRCKISLHATFSEACGYSYTILI